MTDTNETKKTPTEVKQILPASEAHSRHVWVGFLQDFEDEATALETDPHDERFVHYKGGVLASIRQALESRLVSCEYGQVEVVVVTIGIGGGYDHQLGTMSLRISARGNEYTSKWTAGVLLGTEVR